MPVASLSENLTSHIWSPCPQEQFERSVREHTKQSLWERFKVYLGLKEIDPRAGVSKQSLSYIGRLKLALEPAWHNVTSKQRHVALIDVTIETTEIITEIAKIISTEPCYRAEESRVVGGDSGRRSLSSGALADW